MTTAHQQITRDWWETRRTQFEAHISQIVIQESGAGDKDAAERRLAALASIPLLEITDDVTTLAEKLMEQIPLPERAEVDALHIAVAVVNGMDYLLTWNCTHIANASLRSQIDTVCRSNGYEPPIICTPEELMEE